MADTPSCNDGSCPPNDDSLRLTETGPMLWSAACHRSMTSTFDCSRLARTTSPSHFGQCPPSPVIVAATTSLSIASPTTSIARFLTLSDYMGTTVEGDLFH
ncbi:hypothetical protein AXF42_Ash000259 [Apostasia shenzhenica]|uniref:Uncharacterized protein n=1 Tax=Apostasia shenzhenica TaxID=1088818 RepID=A0A2I0AG08_9ASPA|nr:hypothetical protein AXF42_Ash000259 [Apostasia shenzhenica]